MGKNNEEEYDWLNDPFDEKKTAEERERIGGMTETSKALVVACSLMFLLGIAVLSFLLLFGIM